MRLRRTLINPPGDARVARLAPFVRRLDGVSPHRLAHTPEGRARVERLFLIEVIAFDWNCPKYITPRCSAAEVAAAVARSQSASPNSKPSWPPRPAGEERGEGEKPEHSVVIARQRQRRVPYQHGAMPHVFGPRQPISAHGAIHPFAQVCHRVDEWLTGGSGTGLQPFVFRRFATWGGAPSWDIRAIQRSTPLKNLNVSFLSIPLRSGYSSFRLLNLCSADLRFR